MSSDAAQAFESFGRAFNEGDFETAFEGVDPDVEWSFGDWVFDGGVLRGRDAVIDFYRRLRDAGEWRITAKEIESLTPETVLVHMHGLAIGRSSGIRTERLSFVILDFGPHGVRRVREYATREEALAAASAT